MKIKIEKWLADKEGLPTKKFDAEYIQKSISGKAIHITYKNKDMWIPISQITYTTKKGD